MAPICLLIRTQLNTTLVRFFGVCVIFFLPSLSRLQNQVHKSIHAFPFSILPAYPPPVQTLFSKVGKRFSNSLFSYLQQLGPINHCLHPSPGLLRPS